MKHTIHNEVAKHLSQIDKLRISSTDEKIKHKEINKIKATIVNLLSIIEDIKGLLAHISSTSIDFQLKLLMHKFNQIQTKSNLLSLANFDFPCHNIEQTTDNFSERTVETIYLENVLKVCERPPNDEVTEQCDNIQQGIENIETKIREQVMVDLKILTTDEVTMIENLSDECVDNIIESFQNL